MSAGLQSLSYFFGNTQTRVLISRELPSPALLFGAEGRIPPALLVCDEHTRSYAEKLLGDRKDEVPLHVLPPGEEHKDWASVETILRAARGAGLSRDGLFVGLGGGVVTDLTGFAASIYMRGARLRLVSTTLLGMVDAALGGKTGFDLMDIKNMAGTFYPAEMVFMPTLCLDSLGEREWKSGLAELIKTAVLADDEFLGLVRTLKDKRDGLIECISRAAEVKGRIVEADPRETGAQRALLNLGHTFAHALESVAGLGTLSHGEAVAWGMARSCELGLRLGITPRERAASILGLLGEFGFEIRAPHPLCGDPEAFMAALGGDKKKKSGILRFIVPAQKKALMVSAENETALIRQIINGECSP
jgi:3-dehydroquinate synthase